MGCRIVGHGKALPELVVSNDDLARIVETSDEWIVERTGIHNRRIAVNETTTDLGTQASLSALANAGLQPDDIDLIVCMTITPDVVVPSQAALIKARIGASNAVAFDLNAACSGCVYGIDVASTMIEASMLAELLEKEGQKSRAHRHNPMKRALVVGAERLSRITDWADRGTCVLFGDGSGAVVLEWDEKAPGILASFLKNTDDETLCLTADSNHDLSTFPFGDGVTQPVVSEIMDVTDDEGNYRQHSPFILMNGQRVFKFATSAIVEAAKEVCERAGVSVEDVACIVPHQANDRIIRFAAKKLGVPYERWQVSIGETGNTSASSVLMALHDAYEAGRIHPGDLVMCVGFGGGLTAGALLFEA